MVASNRMRLARDRLARELWSPLVPALALVAAALFFANDPGEASLPWLGLAAALLALLLFATRSPPDGLRVLLPLAGLAVWCAVSIAWSAEPDRSWSYSNRTFVYVAFALVGALLGADPGRLLYGLAALLGAVCIWSLAGKVLPWLHEGYGGISRLSAPVGYWNALALLGDIALPIGLCLATRMRVTGTLLVFGWVVVIGMTYSRGGAIVGVVIVVLWMWLSRTWIESYSILIAACVPAAGALAVAFSLSGLTADAQPHATRVRDGLVFGVVLALDAAIAAALTRFRLPGLLIVKRLGIGIVVLGAAATLALGAVHAHSWWRSFSSQSGAELTNSPGRFGESGSNFRSAWWSEAFRAFKAAPLQGTGAGSFRLTNERYRKTSLNTTIEPHDLPIQFLSETGVVGLVLFLGSVGWLVVAGRRRPGPQLALALALPAYFLHGLLDIDWDFAAATAPVFLIAGALAVRRSGRPRPRPTVLLAASGVLVLLVCSLFAVWLGNRWAGQAAAAVGVDNGRAVTLARRARSIDPLLVEPLYQAALAEGGIAAAARTQAARREALAAALGFYKQATRVQPDNALEWYNLGWFELNVLKCPQAAYPAVSRFTVLDGQSPNNVIYAQTLALVNSGKATC